MLEHYGRIQQSDYDQIEQACLRIKQEKDQMMSDKEAHLAPFSNYNEGLDAEYTAPTPPGNTAKNWRTISALLSFIVLLGVAPDYLPDIAIRL